MNRFERVADPPPERETPDAEGTATGAEIAADQSTQNDQYAETPPEASPSLIIAQAAFDAMEVLAAVRPGWAAELGAAFAIEHGGGDPGDVPTLGDLREAARQWAAFASPIEAEAFGLAALDRLPAGAATSRMRRKALAAIWRRCTAAERAAFMSWAAPEGVAA